jgi:hypothetical protein
MGNTAFANTSFYLTYWQRNVIGPVTRWQQLTATPDFLLQFVAVFVGAPEFRDDYALPVLQMLIMNCVDRCNVAVMSAVRFY